MDNIIKFKIVKIISKYEDLKFMRDRLKMHLKMLEKQAKSHKFKLLILQFLELSQLYGQYGELLESFASILKNRQQTNCDEDLLAEILNSHESREDKIKEALKLYVRQIKGC